MKSQEPVPVVNAENNVNDSDTLFYLSSIKPLKELSPKKQFSKNKTTTGVA